MVSTTVKERILIHLQPYFQYRTEDQVPYELSQPGIADAVGVSRPHLSQEIRKVIKADTGLIEEEIKRVKGLKRKRKVYFLTTKGVREAKVLLNRFKDKEITVLTSKGKKKVKLGEIDQHIRGENPLLTAISRVDEEGTLDLSKEEEIDEDIFIDREEEIKELLRNLEAVKQKGGRVLFIVGESGIGKTRLMERFKESVTKNGFDLLSGRAYFESSDPYLPFKKIFDEYVKDNKTDAPKLLSYHNRFGHRAEDRRMLNSQRMATFFEITQDLKTMAEDQPLVLFLDDLQWADAVTLQLIHYLSENLGDSKILLVGAFRPQDVKMNELLREICQRLRRDENFNQIKLKPLKWKHTKKIITGMLGVQDVPGRFVRMIHKLSEGNPLFIKECIKGLLEDGNLDPHKNRYPEDPNKINIPRIIIDIIDRRFDHLSDETRRLLHLGAVIGEEIPFELLLRCSGLNELDAFDHIDILLGTNIWEEDPEEEAFKFSHALVHLAAYKSVPNIKRRHLHNKVAESIEVLYESSIEEHYSDLAKHFEYGQRIEDAMEYYFNAGKHAEVLYAQEDALEMYKKALDLCDKLSSVDCTMLMESIGDVHSVLGNFSSSRTYYDKILNENCDKKVEQRAYRKLARTWERQGEFSVAIDLVDKGLKVGGEKDKEEMCKLYEVKGWALMQLGELDDAMEMFEQTKRLSKELGDEDLQGDSNHNLGTLFIFKGMFEKAYQHLKEAVSIREASGNTHDLAKSLNNIAGVYKSKGNIKKAMEVYERSYELQEEIGDMDGMAGALANLGTLQYLHEDLKSAEENFTQAREIFDNIGDKRGVAMTINNLGVVYMEFGEFDTALSYQREGLSLRQEMGDRQGEAMSYGMMSSILLLKGELENAESYTRKGLKIFEDMGDMNGIALAGGILGDILLEKGNIDEAIQHYEKSYDMQNAIGQRFENIGNCSRLSEAYLLSGELKRSKTYLDEGLSIAKRAGADYGYTVCHRVKGMLLRKEGKVEESIGILEDVESKLEEIGKKPELARTNYELGLSLLENGEKDEGLSYIKSAGDQFDEIGMKLWKEKCDELLSSQ